MRERLVAGDDEQAIGIGRLRLLLVGRSGPGLADAACVRRRGRKNAPHTPSRFACCEARLAVRPDQIRIARSASRTFSSSSS
jgi:hypothetical protein